MSNDKELFKFRTRNLYLDALIAAQLFIEQTLCTVIIVNAGDDQINF